MHSRIGISCINAKLIYCTAILYLSAELFILVFKVFSNTATEHVLRTTMFDIGTSCLA